MTYLASRIQGSGLPVLGPDLTFPSDKQGASDIFKEITGIDGTAGGLVTVLNLPSAHSIAEITLSSLTNAENITLQLTVDGTIVWNDTFVQSGTSQRLIAPNPVGNHDMVSDFNYCKTQWLLEITTSVSTNITLQYVARPIQ